MFPSLARIAAPPLNHKYILVSGKLNGQNGSEIEISRGEAFEKGGLYQLGSGQQLA